MKVTVKNVDASRRWSKIAETEILTLVMCPHVGSNEKTSLYPWTASRDRYCCHWRWRLVARWMVYSLVFLPSAPPPCRLFQTLILIISLNTQTDNKSSCRYKLHSCLVHSNPNLLNTSCHGELASACFFCNPFTRLQWIIRSEKHAAW